LGFFDFAGDEEILGCGGFADGNIGGAADGGIFTEALDSVVAADADGIVNIS
jgi:hypothetical protein